MSSNTDSWYLYNFGGHASESKRESEEAPQARSLEEGVAAAGKYEGDPLDCPCLKDMKEGSHLSISTNACWCFAQCVDVRAFVSSCH